MQACALYYLDALLATAPSEVLHDAAATNYDDILYDQQL